MLCSTALKATASRSCGEYRTTQLGSFSKHQDDPTPARCWGRYTGCPFSRGSTTKLLCWRSKSAAHRYDAIQIRLLLVLFLKPTSTKPTYKTMVATAIYSVTMVLWKETAFPLCRAMERRSKRNVVSLVSSVIVVIRLPISCVSSMAISCHVPAVSMANG